MTRTRIAVLGASGYTGSELVRLLVRHPRVEIAALTADRKAGQRMDEVFPQFAGLDLPDLVSIDEVDFARNIDLVFCALPHGTTQTVIDGLMEREPHIKVVDLSADFRLRDPAAYERWYGAPHNAVARQREAVFGLAELYRDEIRTARLVANPGCHTTTALLPLIPLLRAGTVRTEGIVVDSKTGMSGAGRAAKEAMLFSEVSEGLHAYGVGAHRHMSEFDQELSLAAGQDVLVTFTPHLAPMNRGIYATIYLSLAEGKRVEDLHAVLAETFAGGPFVRVLPFGKAPQSRHVRGSNAVHIGVVADRVPGRAIIMATLDNLMKGASGQAVQNMNLVLGFDEAEGLGQVAMFP